MKPSTDVYQDDRQLRIMIVEDSPADVALFETLFSQERTSYSFVVAHDGEEALNTLDLTASSLDQPDLIILDINLPKVDGKEVLKELKSHSKLRRIPVVVMTSSENEEDIRQSYELGASCVLIKPCDVASVKFLFRTLEDFWVRCVRYSRFVPQLAQRSL